jgi:Zn-dependent protease
MTLSFRLGPIPVRIHAWFLLMGGLVGIGAHGGALGAAGRAIGFLVTVFAHELSHAVVARSFGAPGEVELTFFRGSLGARIASLSRARRVVVCLAGPAANLLASAMGFAIVRMHPLGASAGIEVLRYFAWINLAWGLINLLPILPFDAAQALAAALDGTTKGRGERTVRSVSIALAVVLGGAALAARMIGPALLCGLLAFQNARALGLARELRNREAVLRGHVRAAYDALERGETSIAIGHCGAVLHASTDPAVRKDAVRLLAYAYATSGDWVKLIKLLESGGVQALESAELEKYQRAARELGRPEDAQRIAFLCSRFA